MIDVSPRVIGAGKAAALWVNRRLEGVLELRIGHLQPFAASVITETAIHPGDPSHRQSVRESSIEQIDAPLYGTDDLVRLVHPRQHHELVLIERPNSLVNALNETHRLIGALARSIGNPVEAVNNDACSDTQSNNTPPTESVTNPLSHRRAFARDIVVDAANCCRR